MRLSNFQMVGRTGSSPLDWRFFAAIDVTTGMWWWKKTERKEISRKYADNWFFVESGEYVPGYQVDSLSRAWDAKHGAN